MQKERNSNIELLRIIAMFMIVSSHYIHGLYSMDFGFGINRYFLSVFTSFGSVGVGIFMMITGYFMIEQRITLKKFLKLYLDLSFYSIIIFLLFFVFEREAITIKLTLKSFLPLLYVNWWYFTAYAIIILISPWLNKLLISLTKDEYLKLVILIIVVFSLSRLLYGSLADSSSGFSFGTIIPCVNFYIIGGYIRKWSSLEDTKLLDNRGGISECTA